MTTPRHTLAAALAAGLAVTALAPSAGAAPKADTTSGASGSTAGFEDVMRFGSAIKGTPLAQTSPDADTVFTVIERANGTPEIKRIDVDASGAVVGNHVDELTATWRTGWTEAQIDASSESDVWATADGTLWHDSGDGDADLIALPAGVERAVAVADVAGPDAYVSATTADGGSALFRVTHDGDSPAVFTPLAQPDGPTSAADELRVEHGTLFARYGATVHRLAGHHWKAVATAPSEEATWLVQTPGRHLFTDGLAVVGQGGTVVDEDFTQTLRNGRTVQLAGSPDARVFTMTASPDGDAVWAVTRRGDDAYLQRYAD